MFSGRPRGFLNRTPVHAGVRLVCGAIDSLFIGWLFVCLFVAYLYCPPGWEHFGKSCYKFSQIRKKWSDARLDCHQSGGYLLKIDDGDEQHYITSKAQQLSGVSTDGVFRPSEALCRLRFNHNALRAWNRPRPFLASPKKKLDGIRKIPSRFDQGLTLGSNIIVSLLLNPVAIGHARTAVSCYHESHLHLH